MLTLEEIENVSFRRSGLGGYKIEDVDSFVDGVIEKVRHLELANKELETRIEQLNRQLLKHEEQADSVQDAIITAEITAKKLVKDASFKAEKLLSDAKARADAMVAEADEKAYATVAESDTRAQTILNSALSRSASCIDENNRIIEQQKQHIIRIQSEVTRFREALIDSYKNHLKIINSLPKAEEFKQYQTKLEENYPPASPKTPESVEQDIRDEADKAVEEAKKEQRQIRVELVDADRVREISEEIRTNNKAQAELDKDQHKEGAVSVEEAVVKAADAGTEPEKTVLLTDAAADAEPAVTVRLEESAVRIDEPEETVRLYDRKDKKSLKNKEKQAEKKAEKPDSNADEIRAAVSAEHSAGVKPEEQKPTSIDEIDDGIIFSSKEKEEHFREEKNNRQPILFSEDDDNIHLDGIE